MKKEKLQQIEETYLKIFKVVLIILLTVALLASIGLVGKGVVDMMETPKAAEPEKMPPKTEINVEKFLEQVEPKENAPSPKPDTHPVKSSEKTSALDEMLNSYFSKLWIHFDAYQKACQSPIQVDKEAFEKSFPKHIMRGWFSVFGNDFAESQDTSFVIPSLPQLSKCSVTLPLFSI